MFSKRIHRELQNDKTPLSNSISLSSPSMLRVHSQKKPFPRASCPATLPRNGLAGLLISSTSASAICWILVSFSLPSTFSLSRQQSVQHHGCFVGRDPNNHLGFWVLDRFECPTFPSSMRRLCCHQRAASLGRSAEETGPQLSWNLCVSHCPFQLPRTRRMCCLPRLPDMSGDPAGVSPKPNHETRYGATGTTGQPVADICHNKPQLFRELPATARYQITKKDLVLSLDPPEQQSPSSSQASRA